MNLALIFSDRQICPGEFIENCMHYKQEWALVLGTF